MRYDFIKVVPYHQPIALQMAKGASQHALRNPVHALADLGMAKLAVHSERVNDAERPAVAGMGEHLPAHPVVVVARPSQTVCE